MANSPNYDSVDDERVREHLANERTYLAWLRTALSLMGLGVVFAKLRFVFGNRDSDLTLTYAANVGMVLVCLGVGTVGMALYAFSQVRHEIRERSYKSRIYLVITLSIVMATLAMLVLWYLIQTR